MSETIILADILANADLTDATTRLVLADALTDAGRDDEATLLRDTATPVGLSGGAVVALRWYMVEMRDGQGSRESEEFQSADDDQAEERAEELTRDWVREGDWGKDGASVDAWWTLLKATHRVTCTAWRRVSGGRLTHQEVQDSDLDHWYYLDHVGAFEGRGTNDHAPVWASANEAAYWAGRASADEAADPNGIVPILFVEREAGEEIATGSVTVEIEPDHASLIRDAVGRWGDAADRCCGTDPDDHDWTGGTSFRSTSHCRRCGLHRSEHTTGSQRNPGEHDTVEYTMPDSWCGECEREECECTVTCCVCGTDVPIDDDEVRCIATDHGPDWVCGDCEYEGDDDDSD